jgi:hypothetical protein
MDKEKELDNTQIKADEGESSGVNDSESLIISEIELDPAKAALKEKEDAFFEQQLETDVTCIKISDKEWRFHTLVKGPSPLMLALQAASVVVIPIFSTLNLFKSVINLTSGTRPAFRSALSDTKELGKALFVGALVGSCWAAYNIYRQYRWDSENQWFHRRLHTHEYRLKRMKKQQTKIDMRTDIGKTIDKKHDNAQLTVAIYKSDEPYYDKNGNYRSKRHKKMLISLELLSQIAVLRRSSISMSDKTSANRLELAAGTYYGANLSRFKDLTADVVQNTLLVAYGIDLARKEQLCSLPFTSSLHD